MADLIKIEKDEIPHLNGDERHYVAVVRERIAYLEGKIVQVESDRPGFKAYKERSEWLALQWMHEYVLSNPKSPDVKYLESRIAYLEGKRRGERFKVK